MLLTHKDKMREELGDNLSRLIERFQVPLVEVHRLTTLHQNHRVRGSFQITLADGRRFKGRRLPDTKSVVSIIRLEPFLDKKRFPRILAHQGSSFLAEWIEGEPVLSRASKDRFLSETAEIQAAMHNTPIPHELYARHCSCMSFWTKRLEERINFLINKNIITQNEGKKLYASARIQSEHIASGLIHGDYCFGNMVLDNSDHLYIVDLETISATALAYDLARTLYRCDMDEKDGKAYLQYYKKYRTPEDYIENSSFWTLFVLVESAVFRCFGPMERIKKPLGIIRRIINKSHETSKIKLQESFSS